MTTIKLNLKSNFKLVKEGNRVLKISEAKATPSGKPNKIVLNMEDIEDGAKLINSFSLDNDKSLFALGMLLNVALGLEDGDDFDTKNINELVGIKLLCEISHSEYNEKTYANVKKIISRVDDDEETGEVVSYPDVDSVISGRNAIATDDDEDLD